MLKKLRKKTILILFVILATSLFCPLNLLAQQGGQNEISELSEQIKNKQSTIGALKEKIDKYQQELTVVRSQSNSLTNQITILEKQIVKKEAEIKLNEEQIEETALAIKKIEEEIKESEKNILSKKASISKFLREIYMFDQKSELEVIIMNKSISDFFNQLQRTEKIQSSISDDLRDLKNLKNSLETKQTQLKKEKDTLNDFNETLESKKTNLMGQQGAKESLLLETKHSEKRYQNIVSELKAEQNQINNEIVSLEKTLRQKLSSSEKSRLVDLGKTIFSWPVPSHYITATFHDPDYPFRYIFEHPGIDIRADQGTPLRAATSGYIAKIKDGGKRGYSYIMIIHNDGFATVYGHVSAMYVKTDQFVTQGEVIGATGGMPGTPGAGPLTTGPHLHFEIRLNGVPVNPLDYLP